MSPENVTDNSTVRSFCMPLCVKRTLEPDHARVVRQSRWYVTLPNFSLPHEIGCASSESFRYCSARRSCVSPSRLSIACLICTGSKSSRRVARSAVFHMGTVPLLGARRGRSASRPVRDWVCCTSTSVPFHGNHISIANLPPWREASITQRAAGHSRCCAPLHFLRHYISQNLVR
jgi:hypothetical protein